MSQYHPLSTSAPQFPNAPVTGSTHCPTHRRSGVSMSYTAFKCSGVPGSRGSSAPLFKCPVVPVCIFKICYKCHSFPMSRLPDFPCLVAPSFGTRSGSIRRQLFVSAAAGSCRAADLLFSAASIGADMPWRRLRFVPVSAGKRSDRH